ncbi:hypothetical protein NIES37_27300 [Tolypothrix tenuis PCC 7101]|uniref:ABC transporter-related protein n=1 Tax=Tolypothrix tenuis PCC 7101 TaxID=231146 RepID=A0A1Z4MZ68_9CYAN|nr:hypothetical protein [Aulosira sp. FACHB-113]BAY98778.1 hypothetical protein NIES37_27300 [Tolypothrix tenuis PCC 7101]BAZ77304.1 hypothetical protein NIES50_59330 [Aulosira laxa NIES-50]
MADLDSLIAAKNVHISYKDSKQKFTAVQDVNFSVKSGEKFAIIGPSGCNTCRLRGKGEGEKGQEKTFNPYPFTFSPNQIPS